MTNKKNSLDKWIQSALENKINTKNTWNAPFISHFKKATTILDGCVKVYTTRVDDVSNNANKLVSIMDTSKFKQKAEKGTCEKTKKLKKGGSFVTKNYKQIDLKTPKNINFNDAYFTSILKDNNKYFVSYNVNMTDVGLILFTSDANDKVSKNKIITEDEKVDISIKKHPICPSLVNIAEQTEINMIEMPKNTELMGDITALNDLESEATMEMSENNSESEENQNNFDELPDNFENDVEMHEMDNFENCTKMDVTQNVQTHYFTPLKTWKTEFVEHKKEKKQRKPKEKFKIDFFEPVNYQLIYTKANTIQTKEAVKAARKVKMVMPMYEMVTAKDFYKKSCRPGEYYEVERVVTQNNDIEEFSDNNNYDMSIYDNNFDQPDITQINLDEEIAFHEKTTVTENNANKLTFTKVAKKVDMKKLKENIEGNIKKATSMSSLFSSLRNNYEDKKELMDISKHFCLIGLLHVATEKGIHLENTPDGEVKIIDTRKE